MSIELVAAVRRKRQAEGLSLRALSDVINVSFSTLSRIESGKSAPDNNTRVRLVEWLGDRAEAEGLAFERVAHVHFRARKNVSNKTVKVLLEAADCIRQNFGARLFETRKSSQTEDQIEISLSKSEMENLAEQLRDDLSLGGRDPLEPRKFRIDGVVVEEVSKTACLGTSSKRDLKSATDEWSAMSVPIDITNRKWVVLLNDHHQAERQRVTLLEEFWHILLNHKLTRVAQIAECYGRTFDAQEEHDAFYLATASLLPRISVVEMIDNGRTIAQIAQHFGTSEALVEYRLKRLNLWRFHVSRKLTKIA